MGHAVGFYVMGMDPVASSVRRLNKKSTQPSTLPSHHPASPSLPACDPAPWPPNHPPQVLLELLKRVDTLLFHYLITSECLLN